MSTCTALAPSLVKEGDLDDWIFEFRMDDFPEKKTRRGGVKVGCVSCLVYRARGAIPVVPIEIITDGVG